MEERKWEVKGRYVFVILGWKACIPLGFELEAGTMEGGIEGERGWMSLIKCIACEWDLRANTEDGVFALTTALLY